MELEATLLVTAVIIAALALLIAAFALLRSRARGPGAEATIEHVQRGVERVQDELRELSQVLAIPRARGALGEIMLGELLRSWLPSESYELQHSFSGGERVDAVVRLGNQLVCIDSKFPLEAVRRFLSGEADRESPLPGELRRTFARHIEQIAERYIRPAEGTMGFALMYVPAEGIYHRIFADHPEEVFRSALAKNVVPVSPSTLFLYLQTVAYGLRGMRLDSRVERLADDLAELERSVGALGESLRIAGTHLKNLNRAWDDAGSRFADVERRVDRVADER